MPRQLKDNSVCCKSVTLDRVLCDEVLSRGYNLTEIFNTALAAVLNADDAYQIRYDSLKTMREEMNKRARENRLTMIQSEREKVEEKEHEEESALNEIIDNLCADYSQLGKSSIAYLDGLYKTDKIDSDALEFFNRRTSKTYRSKRYILGLKSVVGARGQRVKALAMLKSELKK